MAERGHFLLTDTRLNVAELRLVPHLEPQPSAPLSTVPESTEGLHTHISSESHKEGSFLFPGEEKRARVFESWQQSQDRT